VCAASAFVVLVACALVSVVLEPLFMPPLNTKTNNRADDETNNNTQGKALFVVLMLCCHAIFSNRG
jgi:hypothetical protein